MAIIINIKESDKTNQPMVTHKNKDEHYSWAKGVEIEGRIEYHPYTNKSFKFGVTK